MIAIFSSVIQRKIDVAKTENYETEKGVYAYYRVVYSLRIPGYCLNARACSFLISKAASNFD